MTVRNTIAEQFTADWAVIEDLKDLWVEPTQNEIKAFSVVTCIISQQSIGAFPQAPIAHRTVGLLLEIVSPIPDIDSAADELEAIVPAILDYLDPRFQHGTAEAFLYGEQFAYRIPVSVIVTKE